MTLVEYKVMDTSVELTLAMDSQWSVSKTDQTLLALCQVECSSNQINLSLVDLQMLLLLMLMLLSSSSSLLLLLFVYSPTIYLTNDQFH